MAALLLASMIYANRSIMKPQVAQRKSMHASRLLTLILLLLVSLLAGCATEVTVRGEVPTPLSQPLPVAAHLVLDEALTQYTYRDEEDQKVTFEIGEAQAGMFRTISQSLFTRVHE